MGWDITYHPFHEQDLRSIYFAGVKDPSVSERIAQEFNIPEFHYSNLADIFARGKELDNAPFASGHGYNAALMAGHLRPYWYLRGSALSFLADDDGFTPYFTDWDTLVPAKYADLSFPNALPENYAAGVFVANAALRTLKNDMTENPTVREKMTELFSHGRLEVFLKAVDYALEHDLGLLEAAEVLIPNPLDLNNSTCYSNLHNCDPAGAILYHKAALEQIATVRTQEEGKTEQEPAPAGEKPKKGFFSRLFGKK